MHTYLFNLASHASQDQVLWQRFVIGIAYNIQNGDHHYYYMLHSSYTHHHSYPSWIIPHKKWEVDISKWIMYKMGLKTHTFSKHKMFKTCSCRHFYIFSWRKALCFPQGFSMPLDSPVSKARSIQMGHRHKAHRQKPFQGTINLVTPLPFDTH